MKSFLKIYSRIVLFLFPFFFLPQIYGAFGLAKISLLLIGGGLGLIIWLVGMFLDKDNTVKWNRMLTWFLILVIWSGVTFVLSPGGVRVKSLMTQSGFGTFLGLLMWLFLWFQIDDKKEREVQLKWLSISGIIVAIGSLIAFMVPVAKMPLFWPKSNPIVSISQGWSLTGTILGEAVLFFLLVVEWLKRLLRKLKDKEEVNHYLIEAVGVVFFGLILFLDFYKMTKLGWGYLDNKTSWIIAVESLKNNPIFGSGVGNFYQAFLSFKPVSFNLTKLWSMTFDSSSMGILNLWTELGLVGLILVAIGVIGLIKRFKTKDFWLMLIISLVVLLLPINLISLVLVFWVLSFSDLVTTKEAKLKLLVGEKNFNLMPYLLAVLILGGVGFASYWQVRLMVADGYWLEAVKAASKNDGTATYNYEIKAIGMNPNMPDYRAVYSQTCLSLAQNFLGKEEVSDSDKESGTTLVQQAVREAKAAVALDQNNPGYWSNLAAIYKSLVGLVDGASDWSSQAYQQAISLSPNDPVLKLNLGGLFYGLNDFESADRAFEDVVKTKMDYANGWYNWAYSAKQLNKLDMAVTRMQQAVSLVSPDSADYEEANKVLTEWKKELDEANKKKEAESKKNDSTSDQKTLTTPETLPTGTDENEIQSNKEMAPPIESKVTPEVSPKVEISPAL